LFLLATVGGLAIWITAWLTPFMIRPQGPLLGIVAGVAAFSLVAAACITTMQRGRARWWMASGIVAAALALAGWSAVWLFDPSLGAETWSRLLLLLMPPSCWAGLMLVTALLWLPRLRNPWTRALRGIVCIVATLLAAEICFATCAAPLIDRHADYALFDDFIEFSIRLGAVLLILTTLGLLAIYALARSPELLGRPEQPVGEYRLTITCPRCKCVAQIDSGGDVCPQCGLRIKVTPT